MRYQITVQRKIQVFVEIEADSEAEAIAKYEQGEYDEDLEEAVDATDIDRSIVCLADSDSVESDRP